MLRLRRSRMVPPPPPICDCRLRRCADRSALRRTGSAAASPPASPGSCVLSRSRRLMDFLLMSFLRALLRERGRSPALPSSRSPRSRPRSSKLSAEDSRSHSADPSPFPTRLLASCVVRRFSRADRRRSLFSRSSLPLPHARASVLPPSHARRNECTNASSRSSPPPAASAHSSHSRSKSAARARRMSSICARRDGRSMAAAGSASCSFSSARLNSTSAGLSLSLSGLEGVGSLERMGVKEMVVGNTMRRATPLCDPPEGGAENNCTTSSVMSLKVASSNFFAMYRLRRRMKSMPAGRARWSLHTAVKSSSRVMAYCSAVGVSGATSGFSI
mmetsp:Transcript_52092/g.130830  ORF Transcript_52092/g.130830 Transcript_52092/m.130830 type:complete len:331 (-) Transcript_52092:1477-2469(-)